MSGPRFVASCYVAALMLAAAPLAAEPPTIRVGVVVDGPWPGNDEVRALTIEEVRTLTEGEFDVRFPEEIYLVGDWTYGRARENVERLLADPGVDVVLTWGVLASHAVCCSLELAKPVVAPVVLDPRLQGLPLVDGASGVRNLSYVSLDNKIGEELAVFRRIVPFRKVAFLGTSAFFEAIPQLPMRTMERTAALGYSVDYIPVGRSVEEALAAIPADVEAVYVWPLFELPPADQRRLIEALNERRLPTFSGWGSEDVEAGMLATATADDFFPRLTRRVALNLQRILLGEEAGTLPVRFAFRGDVVINLETARRIGVSPSWDVLVEARLLHPEGADLPGMSLAQAVDEAVRVNLDLVARQRAVAAGEQEIARARAVLRPQADLSVLGLQIDDDRAAASFGQQAERSLTGSAGLSQLLFSDAALANLVVQRRLQVGRERQLEALRLDVALEAATTYLDLLRAKSLVEIRRNNLEVTRANLELAELRRTIGAANPAEVFRWESQLATDRKALIEATAGQRVAEVALNRILHRDLGQRFVTAEVDLDDPQLITGQDRFAGYIDTPLRFAALADFVVREGLGVAPELAGLEAGIEAAERALAAARRAYWAPTLALQAGVDERFSESGAGADAGVTGLPFELPAADDTDWSIALSATLPIFAGGARAAEVVQAEEEATRLRLEYQSAAERIEQRIRSALEVARASYAGIELARQAAAAAGKGLELVSDAYARGAVSILDLLDAQAAALNADELAANAVYDFFIDLMEAQRAANRFDFFMTAEELDGWFRRLEEHFAVQGLRPQGAE